jgi:integrase
LEKLHEHACRARWADRSINLWPDVTGTLEHRQRPAKGRFTALPWQDVPGVFARIKNAALRFLILTMTRSGEVRGATWSEVDLAAGLWVIPAERMKMRQLHRVPLSDQALTILRAQPRGKPGDLIFPGVNGQISDSTFVKALRHLGLRATAHGFRSSARDWMRESAKVPHDVAEQCLAHKIGSAVMQAYLRGDLLEERRPVLAQWGDYCHG